MGARLIVPARHATQAGGIDALASIPGLHKGLKIPAQLSLFESVSQECSTYVSENEKTMNEFTVHSWQSPCPCKIQIPNSIERQICPTQKINSWPRIHSFLLHYLADFGKDRLSAKCISCRLSCSIICGRVPPVLPTPSKIFPLDHPKNFFTTPLKTLKCALNMESFV